jgi:hypothetical protein
MPAAIYFNPRRTALDWHHRMAVSLGLEFCATSSVGETLEQMESATVPLVMLTGGAEYPLDEAAFTIKACHGDAKIIVLGSTQAPDRLPAAIDAWICVAEHEEIVRNRLLYSLKS